MKNRTSKMFDNNKITLVVYVTIFIVLFTSLVICFTKTFRKDSLIESLSYEENSVLNYYIKLKPNEFYETETLPENMEYVANLIDEVDLTFNYLFSSTEVIDYNVTYSIDAVTRVYNEDENKVLFERKENLVEPTIVNIKDIKDYTLKRDVIIDYDRYNNLAKSFKSTYSLTTTSDLDVVLSIKSNDDAVNIDSKSIVKIPLTEKTINISIDSNNINNSSTIEQRKLVNSVSKIHLILFCILFVLCIYILTKIIGFIIYLNKLKTPYEQMLGKILKENDSIIANVKNNLDENKYEYVLVDTFEELRDVHDNIGNPILFYEVEEGKLSYFLIVNDNIVYRYILDSKKLNGGNL